MRIIAGKRKGKRLLFPRDLAVKPLTDRIKESLFAMIDDHVPGARVLDLFAGSGSFGLEAISRDAKHAAFVDRDQAALSFLRKNLAATEFTSCADVYAQDAFAYLERAAAEERTFSLIFMDPPFALVKSGDFAAALTAHTGEVERVLDDSGLLIVRVPAKTCFEPVLGELSLIREKTYGRSRVLLLGRT